MQFVKKVKINKKEIKNKVMVLSAALTALAAAACGGHSPKQVNNSASQSPDLPTSEITQDYVGVYKGIIPAADCPGIEVTLTLGKDGNFEMHEKYLERESEFHLMGEYAVEQNVLTLEGSNPTYLKIEAYQLRYLDAQKQPIEGVLAEHYVLRKVID